MFMPKYCSTELDCISLCSCAIMEFNKIMWIFVAARFIALGSSEMALLAARRDKSRGYEILDHFVKSHYRAATKKTDGTLAGQYGSSCCIKEGFFKEGTSLWPT